MLLRMANYLTVFPGGGRVIFPGQDPYYHMRRIFLVLQDYPSVPGFDRFMNFPFGATIIWPPLFDFAVASFCLLFGFGPQDAHGVETLAAFVTPLLGAGTILLVYYLGRTLFDRSVPLLAAGLLALSPAHAWYSRLGFVDHHTAATLLQAALFTFLVRSSFGPAARRALSACAGAFSLAAGLLCWNGFVLYGAIIGGCLLVAALIGERERGPGAAAVLLTSYTGGALLALPFAVSKVMQTGQPFSSVTLSYFQVGVTALIGLAGGAAWIALSKRYRALPLWCRIVFPALAAMVVIAFLVSQTQALGEGLGWLFREDRFISTVNESLPLVNVYKDSLSGSYGYTLPMTLTFFHLLFPIALVAYLVAQRRAGKLGSAGLMFAMWTAALFLMACGQRRFMEVLAPALALLTGWFMVWLYRLLPRPATVAVLFLVAVFAYSPWYAGLAAGRNRSETEYDAALYETLTTFKTELPADGRPTRGVMNPWQLGHKILYLTGLPVVSNNFGSHIGEASYRDWSAFFLAEDEARAIEMLEERELRYVVVDYDMESMKAAMRALGRPEERYLAVRAQPDGRQLTVARAAFLRTMFYRLAVLDGRGAVLPGDDGGNVVVPALERLRLIERSRGEGRGHIKIYELK